jgi:hypothetical protein
MGSVNTLADFARIDYSDARLYSQIRDQDDVILPDTFAPLKPGLDGRCTEE